MPVITHEQAAEKLSPIFKGKRGKFLFDLGIRLTGIDKVNRIHDKICQEGIPYGPQFAHGIMEQIQVDFRIGNAYCLQNLPEGAFIAISNHVYGHLDGICLMDILGQFRPQIKVMVNEMLMWIYGLAPNFISVNPIVSAHREATSTSINGVKNALLQIRQGQPLAIFPSGAVADWKPGKGRGLIERDWQDAAVRLIRKAHVPVVPIRFADHNSWFYYALGLIDYRVRFARLFHELTNKRGTHPRMIIGPTIGVEQLDAVPDEQFKAFLRSSVYDLQEPEHYTLRSELWKK